MKSLLKFLLFINGLICYVKTQQDCGNSPITSGLEAWHGEFSIPGEWPWLASIFQIDQREKYICGSTLISNLHVLTAAHCVHDKFTSPTLTTSNTRVYLGRTNFSDANENFEVRGASDILLHPDWDLFSESFDADIALIKLSSPVRFTDNIKPACMPVDTVNIFDIRGFVAGYGLTEHSKQFKQTESPKHIEIPTVTQGKCLFDNPDYAKQASERTFCAGDIEAAKIPCNGDSGGGFYSKTPKSKKLRVFGIVSASAQKDGKCDPDHFVLFTNVLNYVDWIYTHVPELKPKESKSDWYSYKNEQRIRRDTVFVQEGTVKAYIGRRWHDSKLIVGKFIVEWNSFYIPYFGKELSFQDGDFELLEISEGSANWVQFNNEIPSNAVEGGHEGTVKLYIGKKLHNGVDLIGKITGSSRKLYVPYNGKEIEFNRDFQVLVINS